MQDKKKTVKNKLKVLASAAVLPVVVMWDGIKVPNRKGWKRAAAVVLGLFFLWQWIGLYRVIWVNGRELFYETGWWEKEFSRGVLGTSMLPTIKSGETIKLLNPKKHGIRRGDIVSFTNIETDKLKYLKRVIGMPGEKVSLQNGQVIINGQVLAEPYLAPGTKTYGNTFLTDCEEKQIPDNSFLVMGDNRPASWDGRAVGWVDKQDIDGVVQREGASTFVTSQTGNAEQKLISPAKVLEVLNNKRKEEGNNQLVASALLSDYAQERSEVVRDNLDSWKKGLMPIEKMLDTKGYRYNLVHEYVAFGYLTEEQVIDQAWESETEKTFLSANGFMEAGVGVKIMQKGQCSFPLTTIILSWPSVPSYAQSTIDYWKKEALITKQIVGDLQSWIGSGQKNEAKLKEGIQLSASMSQTAEGIAAKMERREWLTSKDFQDIKDYQVIGKQNQAVLDELFPKVKGIISEQAPVLW